MKEKVKAFVLKDGQVIPEQLLQRYVLKESKQIKGDDEFTSFYQQNQIVQPKYDPKLLADLMEVTPITIEHPKPRRKIQSVLVGT